MVFKGQDAWRKHPLLVDCHKKPFPAFGIALKIFAVYLVVDCYVKYITGKKIALIDRLSSKFFMVLFFFSTSSFQSQAFREVLLGP